MTAKRNPVKTEKHHWWPGSLSRYWAREDGCVTQVMWNAEKVHGDPYGFGFTKNTHHLKHGEDSPWNASFERDFQNADTEFPNIVDWLLQLEVKCAKRPSLTDRLLAQPMPSERRDLLSECIASLIVRSPRTRNNIRLAIEPARVGLPDPRADKTLLAANLVRAQGAFHHAIKRGGKFVALITDSKEFVWGDGFLHSFPVVPDHISGRRCVIPVLPTVSILFVQPPAGISYPQPELMTLLLRENEIDFFNDTIQIYSCDKIFYRHDEPRLIEYFTRREHLEYVYDDAPLLADLIKSAWDCPP